MRGLEAKSVNNAPEEKNQNRDSANEADFRRPWVKPTLECLSLKEALAPGPGTADGGFVGS
jgi:hypothetical protein